MNQGLQNLFQVSDQSIMAHDHKQEAKKEEIKKICLTI